MVTEMKDKTADCPINSQSKRSAGIDKVESAQAFRRDTFVENFLNFLHFISVDENGTWFCGSKAPKRIFYKTATR